MLEMRRRILRIIPEASEVISYGMPAFQVDGEIVAGMLAAKKHVGYYPFSGSTLGGLRRELAKYSTTKSAIHVPPDAPISSTVLRKLISARRSEISRDSWESFGLAAPACRALRGYGLHNLHDLTKRREPEIASLHGIGKNAIVILRAAMKKQRLAFKR
jgi:uncharacterized protein YdhG (YjbR/CyaY superfamily)